jgi:hypothetical protein
VRPFDTPEAGQQVAIYLDRDDAPAAFRERAGQQPAAGAYFNYEVILRD